jgi:hypothetical protein
LADAGFFATRTRASLADGQAPAGDAKLLVLGKGFPTADLCPYVVDRRLLVTREHLLVRTAGESVADGGFPAARRAFPERGGCAPSADRPTGAVGILSARFPPRAA